MSDSEEFDFKINTKFAESYERMKREEDVTKIKEQFRGQELDEERLEKIIERKRRTGVDQEVDPNGEITIKVDGSDVSFDSDEELEDDNGALVTPEVDSQILKTLVLIKTKNAAIYDSNQRFFDEKELELAREERLKQLKEANKTKPVTLKTIQQDKFNKGVVSEESEDEPTPVVTHAEEQWLLKEKLKSAIDSQVKEDDSDEDFFMKRKKTEDEKDLEEEDYRQFLLQEMAKVDSTKEVFDQWASYKNNPKVSQDDAFLMDYVLNRGWIDKNVGKVPTYEEIVGEIEDEEQIEKTEAFEKEYNFRFEEPGGIDIITYSRNPTGVVREKKSKRRAARLRKRERERALKVEEEERLKRLKNEKMAEITETLNHLKRITGDNSLTIKDLEATMEGDFDPNQFNSQLNSKFNAHSNGGSDSEEKPVFDDEIDIGDIEAKQSPEEAEQVKLAARKMLDDYYNLDYEDEIDGLKTRFKYRQVEPATGGLDVMDILLADDKDLNDIVPLKKIAPFTDDTNIKPKYSKVRRLRRKLVEEGTLNPADVDVGIPIKPQDESNTKDDFKKSKKLKKSKKSKH